MSDRKVRGSVVNSYLKYIKKTWGEAGLKHCCDITGIDPDMIRDGAWYPDDYNDRIFRWLVETKGSEYLERANKYTTTDLGLLSYIVRFMNVKTILNKFPANYKELFNYGRIEIEVLGEREVKVMLVDCATSEYSCPAWIGAFKGVLEMTNTKGKVEETKCQLTGAPNCEFILSW